MTAADADRLIMLYGTLRDPRLRRELGIEGRMRRIARCRLAGILYNLGPYPALGEGEGIVHGELFEVTDPTVFGAMDAFEEYDAARPKLSAYLRVRVRLADPVLECWVYRYNRTVRGVPRVPGGDWIKHRRVRMASALLKQLKL
jgi:gamma-glutamylcyclotransferase (GGCT)/AIG2-like uncharacterized protein YtfP